MVFGRRIFTKFGNRRYTIYRSIKTFLKLFTVDVDFSNLYESIEGEILRFSLKRNFSVTDAELVIELKV